jgi:hypothetical protein
MAKRIASTPPQTDTQVLRSLVLMRAKNSDHREWRERTADGVTLRQFTDFCCDPVPKHDAFNRGFTRLTPQTLKVIKDLVVQGAVGLGLEDCAKVPSASSWPTRKRPRGGRSTIFQTNCPKSEAERNILR